MEIDQLETFIAVATFGGFHRAAETLRLSQPAVSARIKALEESLGSTLFARSRNALTLSDAGRILRPLAQPLLQPASPALQDVHELHPASRRRLHSAAADPRSVCFLPHVLRRSARAHLHILL